MLGSPGITIFDSVLFSILVLVAMYLIGLAFLTLISRIGKKSDSLSSMDFLQKMAFRIFSGFIFVFLISLIFSSFIANFQIISILILVISSGILLTFTLKQKFKLAKLRSLFAWRRPTVFSYRFLLNIIAIVCLLVCLVLSSNLISGMFGSTNDDGGFHTTVIRIILDNPSAILTGSTQPYAAFVNTYPISSHVFSAFFVSVFNVPIEQIIVLFCSIVPCLISLSVYFTTKCLFGNRLLSVLGMFLVAFFTLTFSWGPLSWGGLPLLLSFYVTINGMGIIYLFFDKKDKTIYDSLLVGFSFFLAINTYPSALLVLSVWFFTLFMIKIVAQALRNSIRFAEYLTKENLAITISLCIPVLLALPYISLVTTHANAFSQNYPSDVQYNQFVSGLNTINVLVKTRISFNWILDITALSNFFSTFSSVLACASLGLILIIGIYVANFFGFKLVSSKFLSALTAVYLFFLVFMSLLTLMIYQPVGIFAFFDTERVWEHLFIPAAILSSAVLFAGSLVFISLIKRMNKAANKFAAWKRHAVKILLVLLLVSTILIVSFTSISLASDSEVKYGEFGALLHQYATIGADDVSLMNWIKANTSSNAVFLVSSGDAGQYLTAVTQRPSVYSYDLRRFSQSYMDLMSYMTSNPSDERATELLIKFKISYIYIGSIGENYSLDYSFRHQFNATILQSIPYFTVSQHIGNAWIFQFNASMALAYELSGS